MNEVLPKRTKIDAGIDMTPLIDVVFQLLIFLMVSSQFTKPVKQVELPTGAQEATAVEQNTETHTLTITSQNELLLNGTSLTRESFSDEIQRVMAASSTKRLEIRGDTDSNLGTFIDIIEAAKVAGVQSLSYHKKAAQTKD